MLNMVKILAIGRHFFEKIRMIKSILRSVSLESLSWIRRMSFNQTIRPSVIATKKIQKKIKFAEKHLPSLNFISILRIMEKKEEITSDKIDHILEGFEDYEELESILEQLLIDLKIKLEA
uniref:Charged multivesicular body protein 2a (inferred by orthology to a human protein) n=1 Tax=Strongyloides venezuelensis TaxID=75913 RepID=A0A0K0G413_STRVS